MSIQESERLLKEADGWEASKRGWVSAIGDWLTVGLVLGIFVAAAVALWLLSKVIGPTPAGLIGLFAVLIWLGRRE